MNALIALSCLGILALLAEIFNFRKALFPLVMLGLLGVIALAIMDWKSAEIAPIFKNMMRFDHMAILFTCIMCFTLFLWMMMSPKSEADCVCVLSESLMIAMAPSGRLGASPNNFL